MSRDAEITASLIAELAAKEAEKFASFVRTKDTMYSHVYPVLAEKDAAISELVEALENIVDFDVFDISAARDLIAKYKKFEEQNT